MKRQLGDYDDSLDLENKAKQLIETLIYNHEHGGNNVDYLKFVLQSWYDDGYYEAVRMFFNKDEKENANGN